MSKESEGRTKRRSTLTTPHSSLTPSPTPNLKKPSREEIQISKTPRSSPAASKGHERQKSTTEETQSSEEELLESSELLSAEELRHELESLVQIQRKHHQDLVDKVSRIHDYFTKRIVSEEKLFLFLERLEEVETTLNEEDMQAYFDLSRKMLLNNQAKRRETLTAIYNNEKKVGFFGERFGSH